MTVVQKIFIAALMVLTVTNSPRAQETGATPPQNPKELTGREKEKIEEETRKRLQQLACGPSGVHFLQHTGKEPQVFPEQPPDRGLIYVIRTKSPLGALGHVKLAMDGKWMGTNGMGNYFYFEADPGPHYFCVKEGLDSAGLLSLVIEKGKTYYLRQILTMGGIDLDLLEEQKGKEYVAKFHRSFFEEKQKK